MRSGVRNSWLLGGARLIFEGFPPSQDLAAPVVRFFGLQVGTCPSRSLRPAASVAGNCLDSGAHARCEEPARTAWVPPLFDQSMVKNADNSLSHFLWVRPSITISATG